MKRQMYIYFSILCIIALFFETVQAEILPIWQIGDPNNYSSLEFNDPDTKIIEYNVPENWKLLLGQSDPN